MKRSVFPIFVLALLSLAFTGCSSDDDYPTAPIILPFADFTMAGQTVSPATITFNNLSENADVFEWDFGDGRTSTHQNPVITFDTYGVFSIRLKAIRSENGRSETKVKSLTISPGRVFIEQIRVEQIPYVDPNGYTWDLFAYTDPDIYWSIEDASRNTLRESNTYRSDVSRQMLPITFYISPSFELPNPTRRYYITLWDYDDGISDELIQGGYFDLQSEFESELYPDEIYWDNPNIPFEMTVTIRWQ